MDPKESSKCRCASCRFTFKNPNKSALKKHVEAAKHQATVKASANNMSVYVSNKQHVVDADVGGSRFCGSVSHDNNALFRLRLHLACMTPVRVRYVYMKAHGEGYGAAGI